MNVEEQNYIIWDYSQPGISFCLKSGRVTIFKTTLAVMEYPEFYRFLYKPGKRHLAIEPCDMNDPGSYALVNVKQDETYDVNCKDFVRMMYRENGWNHKTSYRIAGIAHPQQRAVEFDLTKALEIHEGRVMENRSRIPGDNQT